MMTKMRTVMLIKETIRMVLLNLVLSSVVLGVELFWLGII